MGLFGSSTKWDAVAPLGLLCIWLVVLGGVELNITGGIETMATVSAFVGVVATFAVPPSMMLVVCCVASSFHAMGAIFLYPCLAWALTSQPGLLEESQGRLRR
jgi:hypothetical protein